MDRFVFLERFYFLWEELISFRNQYAQILKRFLLAFFVFCSWKDLFLSNRKDFLIPIQNATKTSDFLPIFRFNFKKIRPVKLPRCQIKSHPECSFQRSCSWSGSTVDPLDEINWGCSIGPMRSRENTRDSCFTQHCSFFLGFWWASSSHLNTMQRVNES